MVLAARLLVHFAAVDIFATVRMSKHFVWEEKTARRGLRDETSLLVLLDEEYVHQLVASG